MNVCTRIKRSLTIKRFADGKLYSLHANRFGGGWVFQVMFGPGGGYCVWSDDRTKVLVYGRTLYVGWKSGSREWQRRFRNRGWWSPLEVGFTRNGAGVPHASQS